MKFRGSWKRAILTYAAALLAATSLGCVRLDGKLSLAESCEELEDELHARAIEEMERKLDANLDHVLTQIGAVDGETDSRGVSSATSLSPCLLRFNTVNLTATSGSAVVPLAADSTSSIEAPVASSGTNNQVAGVEEADFVKHDGSHIYILADGRFQILDAWPPEDAHRIASIPIEGDPRRLFVHGDRAVVYAAAEASRYTECTYGYDCEFTGDGSDLTMVTIDITDRSQPEISRETLFTGSFLSARRLGDIAHTVVSFQPKPIEYPTWPEDLARHQWGECGLIRLLRTDSKPPDPTDDTDVQSEEEVRRLFAELEESNRALIAAHDILGDLPSILDRHYTDEGDVTEREIFDICGDFYLSDSRDGRALLSLVSMDLTQPDSTDIVNVVSRPGAVYSSDEALYVANRHYRREMNGWFPSLGLLQDEATSVHKFALEAGSTRAEYRGSGVVKGRVLNQFSMDEHEGHLRIATTTGRVPNPKTHSTLSVLREVEGESRLAVVGEVDEIAPTEDIRSVRFDGDTGFIVTFKKTDPLFAFDLSDPESPTLRGELKIPGYSTYMHLLDDDHLLTIGYDADDQGSFAWFAGIQLQILDVSDLDDPRLIHREIIGSRGTSSEAATDHLAFNYYPDRGLLAIPMTLCEDSNGGGSYGSDLSFSGLLVYHVSVEDGLSRVGGVDHFDPDAEPDVSCGNWWTNSNSVVQRSIFMSDIDEDFVYSIARDEILISSLELLEEPVREISLQGSDGE